MLASVDQNFTDPSTAANAREIAAAFMNCGRAPTTVRTSNSATRLPRTPPAKDDIL